MHGMSRTRDDVVVSPIREETQSMMQAVRPLLVVIVLLIMMPFIRMRTNCKALHPPAQRARTHTPAPTPTPTPTHPHHTPTHPHTHTPTRTMARKRDLLTTPTRSKRLGFSPQHTGAAGHGSSPRRLSHCCRRRPPSPPPPPPPPPPR
jgi:hypothetical protein